MSYQDDRRQEILDGKHRWSVEDAGGDYDVFNTQFVVPLRQLRAEGMFDNFVELTYNIDGDSYIGAIEIVSAINFDT